MKTDEELLAELKSASRGLFVMSESDYPFETLYLEGAQEPGHERLRELALAPPDAPIETRSLEDFFRSRIYYPGLRSEKEEGPTPSPDALCQFVKENLTDSRVYRVGRINIAVLIIGKSPEGNWLGLQTRVVET